MHAVRRWSVRHARGLESAYRILEPMLVALDPIAKLIGYRRLERPVVAVEKLVKGFLFDCRMCGHCVLNATGMSCPMNCPKQLRNGPCGGVRQDGGCEVTPEMRCVWVDAWEGSARMRGGGSIRIVQVAVDFDRQGCSSWLHVMHDEAARHAHLMREPT